MPASVHVSRRTTLVSVALGAGLLVGCDIDPPRLREPLDNAPPPPEDADLVARVVRLLDQAGAAASAVAQGTPALAGLAAPLALAHAAHRDLLARALPEPEPPTEHDSLPPRRPAGALRHLRRVERNLLRELEQACVEANSGDLARVLASTAASTTQYLVVIDRESAR